MIDTAVFECTATDVLHDDGGGEATDVSDGGDVFICNAAGVLHGGAAAVVVVRQWMCCMLVPQDSDKKVTALRELNAQLLHDDRIDLSIVPVGDGIALCRRLK